MTPTMTKYLVIVTGDIKGAVEISKTSTLKNVRTSIEEEFDYEMLLPSGEEFCFYMNDIRIARKQETRRMAWNLTNDNTIISLHPKQGSKRKVEACSSREEQSTTTAKRGRSEDGKPIPTNVLSIGTNTCVTKDASFHSCEQQEQEQVELNGAETTDSPLARKRLNYKELKRQDKATRSARVADSTAGIAKVKDEAPSSPLKTAPVPPRRRSRLISPSFDTAKLKATEKEEPGGWNLADELRVRYNVIKSRKDENTLPALDLSIKDAIRLLQKLNFRYCWSSEGYKLPGITKKEAKVGVNTFPEKPDLWVYLARHGLPDNCPFENITPSERLALEQFIADFESKDLDL
jgi:hypothetical protein